MKHLISYIHFDNKLNIKRLKHFQESLVYKVFDGQPIDKSITFPTIQFKLFEKNLFVVAFDDYGLMFIDKIINRDLSSVSIDVINQDLRIKKVYVKNYEPAFLGTLLEYRIDNYIPFHSVSYVNFRALDPHNEQQINYFRRFVKRHLGQFMRLAGMGKNEFNEKLILEIKEIEEKPTRLLYNMMLKPFTVTCRVNLMLPSCVGIGRLNKYGFGNITPID